MNSLNSLEDSVPPLSLLTGATEAPLPGNPDNIIHNKIAHIVSNKKVYILLLHLFLLTSPLDNHFFYVRLVKLRSKILQSSQKVMELGGENVCYFVDENCYFEQICRVNLLLCIALAILLLQIP